MDDNRECVVSKSGQKMYSIREKYKSMCAKIKIPLIDDTKYECGVGIRAECELDEYTLRVVDTLFDEVYKRCDIIMKSAGKPFDKDMFMRVSTTFDNYCAERDIETTLICELTRVSDKKKFIYEVDPETLNVTQVQ